MTKFIIIFSSTRTLDAGGVGTHLRHLINEIKKNMNSQNYKIILGMAKINLIKTKILKILLRMFDPNYSEIVYLNTYLYYMSKELQRTLSLIDLNSYDKIIIHCHERQTAMAAQLVCRKNDKIKIIQTLHAPFSEQFRMSHKNNLLIYNYAKILDSGINVLLDTQIAVDKLEKEIADNLSHYNSYSTIIIPNAVDTAQLDSLDDLNPIKKEFDISKYFIIARHLFEKNGIIYGIKGYHEFIKNNHDEYKLIIMGDGSEKQNLQDYINKNNIGDSVKLIGKRNHNDAIRIIKNAYLSIIPSIPVGIYIEATSLTMLESMYLGIPVLASNIGGLAETIKNRIDGILFEPKDIDGIKNSIEQITNDRVLYKKIRENSKQKIVNGYSSKKWYKKMENIYDSL